MYFRNNSFLILILLLLINIFPIYSQAENNSQIDQLFAPQKLSEPIKLEARIDIPLELDLKNALAVALKQNLDITQANYEEQISKWTLWENLGNWLPDYSLGLSASRFDGTFLIGGVFPIMTLTSNANAYMRFDYRFFEGGRGLFNTLAAKHLYKASKENVSTSLNNILLSVTKRYYELLGEQAQLSVFKKAVEEANANYNLNQEREARGIGTKFEILQSEALLAEQEQLLISQQAKFREASIALARLLNLDQGTHIKPDRKDLQEKELFSVDRPIQEIISLAKDNRPEIKKAILDHSAHRNYIGVAFADFLPKANFYGQYGGTGNVFFHRTKRRTVTPDAILLDDSGNPISQTLRLQNQVSASGTMVSNVVRGGGKSTLTAIDDSLMSNKFIGIEVNWGIGDGLGVPSFSRIQQARNKAKLYKTMIDDIKQGLEEEVRASYLNIQTAKKLLDVAKKRLQAATEALRLAKLRLENGVGINLELLTAQKQHTEALASHVDAIINYNIAQAEILHSTGLINAESLIKIN